MHNLGEFRMMAAFVLVATTHGALLGECASARRAPAAHSCTSRRELLLALPTLAALPAAVQAAATGGGFAESGLASQGSGPPKELRRYKPSETSCSKCIPTDDELKRLSIGYQRLQYLLSNWEKETTVCIKGCVGKPDNCGCIRDPLVVQARRRRTASARGPRLTRRHVAGVHGLQVDGRSAVQDRERHAPRAGHDR